MKAFTRRPRSTGSTVIYRAVGSEAYAMEEVVAEAGACMILADLGIAARPLTHHAAYISSWLKVLGNDTSAIFTAARKAQAAADWMHAHQPGQAVATAA